MTRKRPPATLAVNTYDLWPLLLHGVRYATGRMSTAPSTAQDHVYRYHLALTDDQLAQIASEVREDLGRSDRVRSQIGSEGVAARVHGGWLGHECDHRGWEKFVAWCDAEVARRKAEVQS